MAVPDDIGVRPEPKAHVVNHLASVLGTVTTAYFLWSMVLDPGKGPLPGTLLPLAVGLAGLGVGLALLGWGGYRTFVKPGREETD